MVVSASLAACGGFGCIGDRTDARGAGSPRAVPFFEAPNDPPGIAAMHGMEEFKSSPADSTAQGPWWRLLTRYHWFVLVVAALGWLFDCLDQQLFILARPAAMAELVPGAAGATQEQIDKDRKFYGDISTSIFIAGWACGGLVFGMLGDRIGRAKTMMITILMYSAFTGLSSFSQGPWDFAFYRFLTGLGVGGEFAVGVALVAEVMPGAARPYTLGLLQALSAIGNISAAFINLGLGLAEEEGLPWSPWRIMFLIGALPALLALVIRRNLKEPEQWQQASHTGAVGKQMGSYGELLTTPHLLRHALLGLVLGCSGVIGLWSVGFYTPDLIRSVQTPVVTREVFAELQTEKPDANFDAIRAVMAKAPDAPTLSEADAEVKKLAEGRIKGRLTHWQSYTSLMINCGAFLGMFGFGALSQRIGRKPAFAMAFVAAFISTFLVFWQLKELWQIFVLVPIMGFCQLSLFAGYAIYFPELFPTRLRSTGTSFCYNVGRFIAALGPLVKVLLDQMYEGPNANRYTGMTMCSVFLLGLLVLPFLPETKGKPLPE